VQKHRNNRVYCIIGSADLSGSNLIPTDQMWSQRLLQTFPNAVSGTILRVSDPVCQPHDKRALYVNTGAIAVKTRLAAIAASGIVSPLKGRSGKDNISRKLLHCEWI
jgi:hypothetical protein